MSMVGVDSEEAGLAGVYGPMAMDRHFSHWDEAEPTKQVVNGVQRALRRACGMMFHMIKKKD